MVSGSSVLDHYYRELLNYFSRQVKDRDAAVDIVQEAYARVLAVQQPASPSASHERCSIAPRAMC